MFPIPRDGMTATHRDMGSNPPGGRREALGEGVERPLAQWSHQSKRGFAVETTHTDV